MKLKTAAAGYSIIVGVSICAVWLMYFATGKVAGVVPAEQGLNWHIAAEFATAFCFIAAGALMLSGRRHGVRLYYISLGMLIYAVVNSPGIYPGVFMKVVFAVTFVFAVVFAAVGLKISDEG